MSYYKELSPGEIDSILARVRGRLNFRAHRMGERDIDFFRDIEHRLGIKRRTTLSDRQLGWIFKILDATKKKHAYLT